MVFRGWQEDEEYPKLRANPENCTEFNQRNHNEVKECWCIELARIQADGLTTAERIRPRICSRAERRHCAVRIGYGEEERSTQNMPVIVGVCAPYHRVGS